MNKKLSWWVLCLILLVTGTLTACQSFQFPLLPTPSPTLKRIFASHIQAQDLPQGWRYRQPFDLDIPGATGRGVLFVTSDPDAFWNVTHDIYVYDKPDVAMGSYDYWVAKEIPPGGADSWITPQELVFNGHADQGRVACLPGNVNGIPLYACGAIARYGDMISILRGIVDGHWLTLSDFQKLLETMDRRIVAAMNQAK